MSDNQQEYRISRVEGEMSELVTSVRELTLENSKILAEIKSLVVQTTNSQHYLKELYETNKNDLEMLDSTQRLLEVEVVRHGEDLKNIRETLKSTGDRVTIIESERKDEKKGKITFVLTIVGSVVSTVLAAILGAKFLS